jgi:hypothetical protein
VQRNNTDGPAPTAERFSARDETGKTVVIEELAHNASENALGGLQWAGPQTHYRLVSGERLERLGEAQFRVVDTGQVLTREEGQHGVTHHLQHQSSAD